MMLHRHFEEKKNNKDKAPKKELTVSREEPVEAPKRRGRPKKTD